MWLSGASLESLQLIFNISVVHTFFTVTLLMTEPVSWKRLEPVYKFIHEKLLKYYFLISFVLLYIASRCSGGKQGVVGESGGRLSQEDASEEEEEGEVVPH